MDSWPISKHPFPLISFPRRGPVLHVHAQQAELFRVVKMCPCEQTPHSAGVWEVGREACMPPEPQALLPDLGTCPGQSPSPLLLQFGTGMRAGRGGRGGGWKSATSWQLL